MNLPTLLLLLMQCNAKSKHCVGLVLMPHIIDRIQIECDYRWHNYTNHKYAANDRCTGQRTVLASLHDCCANFAYQLSTTLRLPLVFCRSFQFFAGSATALTRPPHTHTNTHTHQHCARSLRCCGVRLWKPFGICTIYPSVCLFGLRVCCVLELRLHGNERCTIPLQ